MSYLTRGRTPRLFITVILCPRAATCLRLRPTSRDICNAKHLLVKRSGKEERFCIDEGTITVRRRVDELAIHVHTHRVYNEQNFKSQLTVRSAACVTLALLVQPPCVNCYSYSTAPPARRPTLLFQRRVSAARTFLRSALFTRCPIVPPASVKESRQSSHRQTHDANTAPFHFDVAAAILSGG